MTSRWQYSKTSCRTPKRQIGSCVVFVKAWRFSVRCSQSDHCLYSPPWSSCCFFFVNRKQQLETALVHRTLCWLVVLFVASQLSRAEMCTQSRAAARMANIQQADIDSSGVFKYVLIRVHSREEGDDSEVDIVRGYGWAEYHGESGI